MAEITTNFRDSNNGDLGKNLVSKEYLQSVYPKLASNLFIGTIRSNITQIQDAFYEAPRSNWKQISLTDNASGLYYKGVVAIADDSTVWHVGKVPNSSTFRSSVTRLLESSETWKSFVVSSLNYAGIKSNGTLWIWGSDDAGERSPTTSTTISGYTIEHTSSTNWKTVSTSGRTVLANDNTIAAIKDDGSLWTWGSNQFFTLGRRAAPFMNVPSTGYGHSSLGREFTSSTWKSISIENSAVGIKQDGSLWTWGVNNSLAGIKTLTNISTPCPILFGNSNWKTLPSVWTPSDFCSITSGFTSLFLKNDGILWGWGDNRMGGIPEGFFECRRPHSPKREISGSTTWKQIDCAANLAISYGFGLKTDGTLWRWGGNYNDYTPAGYNVYASPIQVVAGGSATNTWSTISCSTSSSGYENSLAAIKTDGTLWFMGGSLLLWPPLYGSDLNRSAVQEVSLSTNWESISFARNHIMAIKTNGTLWHMGDNQYGQRGNNTRGSGSSLTIPVQEITSSTNWKQVSCSGQAVHAVKDNGTLWSWGRNSYGQLGVNDRISRSTPVQEFTSSTNWKMVSAGYFSAHAIKTDGTLWSWGYNSSAQLGVNDSISRSTPVQEFSSSTNWNYVCRSGRSNVLAVKNDGTLWGWGSNLYSQTGIESGYFLITPVREYTNSKWSVANIGASSGGGQCFIGIKENGTLWRAFLNPLFPTTTAYSSPLHMLTDPGPWKNCSTYPFNISEFQALKTDGTLYSGDTSGRRYLAATGSNLSWIAIEAIE